MNRKIYNFFFLEGKKIVWHGMGGFLKKKKIEGPDGWRLKASGGLFF
jgi:hypothetical protein